MAEQVIISVGREFGSGGHEIAVKLAEKLNIKLYDKNIIDEIAKEQGIDVDNLKSYDEKPKNHFIYRRVRDYSNSMEESLAAMQFDFLKKAADNGESFIVVGRCAEYVLKDSSALVSLFILGDIPEKAKRIMERYSLSESDALDRMKSEDKHRKQYHNEYTEFKWGDSRGYDLSINSSKLGIDKTVDIILDYIKTRKDV